MKLSELFLAAKDHLAMTPDEEREGKTEFICHALERVGAANDALVGRAQRLVEERLGCVNANIWLSTVGGVSKTQVYHSIDSPDCGLAVPAVQQWRAAWLDKLAAEFAAKGD